MMSAQGVKMVSRKLMVLLFCLGASSASAQPVLRWAPADTTIDVGQEASLEIIIDDTLSVRTIEFFINYDSDILSTVGGGPGDLFNGFNLFAGLEEVDPDNPGQLHGFCVVLAGNDWAVGPGSLFRWTVRGDHGGTTDLVTVTVRLLPPGGGEYENTVLPTNTVVVNGTSGAPLDPESVVSLSLFPNPFNPRTTITFAGHGTIDGRLEVFDLQGRRLVELWRGTVSQGRALAWDGRDAAGRLLPSGVYTFLLSTADGRRVTTRGTLLR
jgi:hypothetical protein